MNFPFFTVNQWEATNISWTLRGYCIFSNLILFQLNSNRVIPVRNCFDVYHIPFMVLFQTRYTYMSIDKCRFPNIDRIFQNCLLGWSKKFNHSCCVSNIRIVYESVILHSTATLWCVSGCFSILFSFRRSAILLINDRSTSGPQVVFLEGRTVLQNHRPGNRLGQSLPPKAHQLLLRAINKN